MMQINKDTVCCQVDIPKDVVSVCLSDTGEKYLQTNANIDLILSPVEKSFFLIYHTSLHEQDAFSSC